MNKEKLKKIIVILFVLLIAFFSMTIITKIKKGKGLDGNNEEASKKIEITSVKTHKEYYTVSNIVATYYGYIAENNEDAISNIVNKDYLTNNSIEKIDSEFPVFNTDEMFVQKNDNNLDIYYVYGNVKEYLDSTESKDVYFEIFVDNVNYAFEILPINKEVYDKIINENRLGEAKEIAKNEYNGFSYLAITDMTKSSFIFNDYSQVLKGSIEESYNLLDEEYRNKKFNGIEEYKKYLATKEGLDFSILKDYSVEENDGYTEYNCIDQNGNKFIFREKAVMEYAVMFDDYIIGTQDFLERYEATTEQGRVALNIDRFFKAINDKSYYYAYNCLSEGFRNNYFKTLEEFETYVNQNLYKDFRIEYNGVEEDAELYKCTINIIDLEQEETSTQKTIIMKLKEETDFELSFNV